MIMNLLQLWYKWFPKTKMHTINIGTESIIWIEIEISKMPRHIVTQYCVRCRDEWKLIFPNNKIIISTLKNGVSQTTINEIKQIYQD